MKTLLFSLLLIAAPAMAQAPVNIEPASEFVYTFTATGNGPCREVKPGVGYHSIRWNEIGTISAGTVKLVGSNSSDCSSSADIITAQAITSSGAVISTAAVYTYVRLVTENYAGTGTLNTWYGGYKDIVSASVSVGDVTNAGTFAVQCTSGCSGGVQYTEDAVATADPVGTAINLVRADTPASIAADGDNVAARGNAYGAQYVTLLNQSGAYALSTDSADNAAMSAAPVLMSGGYVASPSDHTDGDAATIMTDIKGRLIVVGQGTAGTAAGGVLTIQGVASMTPVQVTVNTFPDNEPINVAQINGVTVLMGNGASGTGAQRVTIANDSTGVVGLNAGTNLIGKVDIQTSGTAVAPVTDPCDGTTKTFVPIDIVTATTTQLVAASASDKFYLCSLNIGPINAANNVTMVEDDTSACASPTAGIFGGVTAAEGWNIAANGGLTLGNGGSTIGISAATNRYICLITSAASQLSGGITYVLSP